MAKEPRLAAEQLDLRAALLARVLALPRLPLDLVLLLPVLLPRLPLCPRDPEAILGGLFHRAELVLTGLELLLQGFVPSMRLVIDFASSGSHSCLLGGPSDRRFSRWYRSEIDNWLQGQYKYLEPLG